MDTTEDELRREFTQYGTVVSVKVLNDKYIGSGQPRSYGYVEMASKTEGSTAIANLGGTILNNRSIIVVQALPMSDKHTSAPVFAACTKRRGQRKRPAAN